MRYLDDAEDDAEPIGGEWFVRGEEWLSVWLVQDGWPIYRARVEANGHLLPHFTEWLQWELDCTYDCDCKVAHGVAEKIRHYINH